MTDAVPVIITVGRAKTAHNFVHDVSDRLYGGFVIIAVHPLGAPGIDDQDRYLAFVGQRGDETEFTIEAQADRLSSSERSARIFEEMADALDYAKLEYGLSEERVEWHERMEDLNERFPPPSVVEIERFIVLQSLITSGAPTITLVRGVLDDEPVAVLCNIVYGPDGVLATPLCIILGQGEDLTGRLELPFDGATL